MSNKPNTGRDIRRAFKSVERETPHFIRTVPGQGELWALGDKGGVLFVLPELRDEMPPELREAIARRRNAALTGRCACGAVRSVSSAGRISFGHESGCDADDDSVLALLRRWRGQEDTA